MLSFSLRRTPFPLIFLIPWYFHRVISLFNLHLQPYYSLERENFHSPFHASSPSGRDCNLITDVLSTLKLILFEFFCQVLKNTSWKTSLQRELAFLPLFNLFIFSWVLLNMEAVQFTSWFDFLFTWASLVSPSYFWTTLEACVQPSFHLWGELPYTIELLLCSLITKYEYCWTQ